MQAQGTSIASLLAGEKRLTIPYYQRAYVWTKPQWERFLEDMEYVSKANRPYFIGSIILKQIPTQSCSEIGDRREVIDGQQRLTTLAVFFKVLSLLKNRPEIFNQYFVNQLDEDGTRSECKICHNRLDKPFFDMVIRLDEPVDLLSEDSGGKYRDRSGKAVTHPNGILLLYQYLLSSIRGKESCFSGNLTSLLQVVSIDVTAREDEQQIFDTVNSLGVDLTTTELLKNYLFNEGNEDDFNEWWVPVFEKDEASKNYWNTKVVSGVKKLPLIDLFFNAFFMVMIHNEEFGVANEEKLKYMRVEELFSSYRDFVRDHLDGDRLWLVKEINRAAKLFKDFFNPNIRYEPITAGVLSGRINEMVFSIDKTNLIPYVLYLLMNGVEDEEKVRIFITLESYIMRRVVCRSDTSGYNRLFSDALLTNKILTEDAFIGYVARLGNRLLAMPDDDELKNCALNEYRVNSQNIGILYMLETKIRSAMSATSVKGIASYSLEHLMPRTWKSTWDLSGLSDGVISKRDDSLWRLGNLSILPSRLNSSVSNGRWEDKVAGNKKGQGLRECANGLATLSKYLDLPEWTEETIELRANDLYDMMMKVWPNNITNN